MKHDRAAPGRTRPADFRNTHRAVGHWCRP